MRSSTQFMVAKDLSSGKVSWTMDRPSPSVPRGVQAAAQVPSAALNGPQGGSGTVLPFLFRNLDTGETTVMEQEWSEFIRDAARSQHAAAQGTTRDGALGMTSQQRQ